ncbi:B-cell scaffold protein with ankyrin repeats isoform X2 [Ranitomeya imitator]|uniref:B-cell scaffold protein with ankyrin repeats isoform X2 n=1 Tax=Ranitomeya imitator TaxID=111125 RepID=UPI0037E79793
MTKNLLVIYEKSGEEWAAYLKELLTSHLQIDDLFLYDVNREPNEVAENLSSSMWQCKLLVLTRDILKKFFENQSTNSFELLQPSHRVVLMLCGVDSPEELYQHFPFEKDFHVILPDQDPQDYIFIVSTVLNEDYNDRKINSSVSATGTSTWSNTGQEDIGTGQEDIDAVQSSSVLVLPKRVSCENLGELFITMSKKIPKNTKVEIEFCTEKIIIRKKPKQWSEEILYLNAPDFPPGEVTVNVCCGEFIKVSTQIEYFSTAEDLKHLLLKIIDPVAFICQAFNVYTLKELDNVLMKSLKNKISSCEYNLHELTQHRTSGSSEEIPTLLHCAAKLGLKEVALLLMQSPAADCICGITNKYGEDPAKIAEKYGHKDIQAIINQLTEKLKAIQTDIPVESLKFEQEDVYVDMAERAAHQQSSIDSYNNDNEIQADTVNESEQDAQEYAEEDIKEYDDEQVEYNSSYKMLDMADDYCHLFPAENPSGLFKTHNPCLQDETCKTDKKEEWVKSEHSSEDIWDWQNAECDQNSECSHETMCVPVSGYSITEDLHSREDYECLTESRPPEPDVSVQLDFFQERRTDDSEIESRDKLDECSDEEKDHERNEEALLVDSTEDNAYIVFESSVKKKQGWQSHFTSHNPASPEASPKSTIESGASSRAREERTDNNENEPSGELDECSDEEKDHEHDEEPLLVASTEDDAYIIFEPSIKKKQRGQRHFTSHNPAPPEAESKFTLKSGASSSGAQEVKDERFNLPFFRDEYEGNEEDPYSTIYNNDDELYIELPFETADEENPRGKKSFIVHRAPAPAPRPQVPVPDIDDSYISKVFRQKEEEKKIYSTGLYQEKMQLAKHEPQIPAQQYALTGQDELILLQEKVKMGIISVDEALKKFQQWQNEKSGLDLLQQKKLQQLRDNIIGDKTDDERVYDKITIVHQPSALPGKKKTTYGMFDNSIYQKPNKPEHLSTSYYPLKKDNEIAGKSPHTK